MSGLTATEPFWNSLLPFCYQFGSTSQHQAGRGDTAASLVQNNMGGKRISSSVLSIMPANASSGPWRVGGCWPQPSMPGPFRQAYLDVKGEQSLEQLDLAIKMMLAEPTARYLFPPVLK